MKAGFKSSKSIVNTALMSALLVVSKLALASIANVEVVTTLIFSFSYVFYFDAFFAVIIFCALDMIIYPMSLDVAISYFIYFPLMSLTVILLKKCKIKGEIPYYITALIFTASFGFLTTLMTYFVFKISFWHYYFSGILFYIVHLISTLVFMFIGFKPLTETLLRIDKGGLRLR